MRCRLAAILLLGTFACGHDAPPTVEGAEEPAPAVACTELATWAMHGDPALVQFGFVPPGGSGSQTLTVRNVTDQPVLVGFGAPAAGISVEPASAEIPAGEELEIEFRFSPAEALAVDETITIDDGCSQAALRLVGTSIEAPFSCTPETLEFGDVPAGGESRRTFRCTNEAAFDVELQLGEMCYDGAPYQFRFTEWAVTVPAGGSAEIGVDFLPREPAEGFGYGAISSYSHRTNVQFHAVGVEPL